ncbi:MAG: hypothetical protein Q8P18_08910 [Pseudomonadota bacterium]|nr:hypothetical protein [Pseudomonadota bacterium]
MLLLAPLWLATAALGAPLAPSGLQGVGVEVSAYTGGQRAWLREAGCTGTACDAWRADTLFGGEVAVGLAAPVAIYAHAAYVTEEMEAALYTAEGYAAGAGARFTIPLSRLLAVNAWAGVEHQFTGNADLSETAAAWAIDAGATLRGGRADEGVQAWAGVGVVPWSRNPATVLDGDVTVTLAARLPVEAVAGVMLASEPLFGPWNDRTRLAAGVTASYGFRSGVTGFITLLH